MFNANRQMYINRQSSDRSSPTVQQNPDPTGELLIDTLKTISSDLQEMKKLIREIREKLDSLDSRQKQLENEFDKHKSKDRITESDISSMRTELDNLSRQNHSTSNSAYTVDDSKPVMPGTGFASITAEYLRNLNKR